MSIEQIMLPNNCRRSKINVSPRNWASARASTKVRWRVFYRFYDDNTGECRLIPIKGMNHLADLVQRQEVTKQIIQDEDERLRCGFNPILKQFVFPEVTGRIEAFTPLPEALTIAQELIEAGQSIRSNIKSMLDSSVLPAIHSLGMSRRPVSETRLKDIIRIMEQVGRLKGKISGPTYNHYRSYLRMLFKKIVPLADMDVNPVRELEKKKVGQTVRKVLTPEQRKLISERLPAADPYFWRLIQIYFHSGCRGSELAGVRLTDVDLQRQRYKITVRKRNVPTEVWKPIKNVAVPLWHEVIDEAKKIDSKTVYLFAARMRPGLVQIHPNNYTRWWQQLVKDDLGIDVDLYALKHLNTTEMVEMLGEEEAAKFNSHTSSAMVRNIYDVRRKDREFEEIKKANNPFF